MFSLRFNAAPPTTSAMPARNPIATRSSGEIRLCSNEYFTKKGDAEEKGKTTNPGEHFRAHEIAPSRWSRGRRGGLHLYLSTGVIGFVSALAAERR